MQNDQIKQVYGEKYKLCPNVNIDVTIVHYKE